MTGLAEFRAECARRGLSLDEGRVFLSQLRARTRLMSELADEDLTTPQLADVISGARSVAEVLAERDHEQTADAIVAAIHDDPTTKEN
jgi:hypothetical protein